MVITAALTATASVGHPKQSTWQTKWRDIEHQLAELEEYYVARPAVSSVSVRLMVEHLLESLPRTGRAAVEDHRPVGISGEDFHLWQR